MAGVPAQGPVNWGGYAPNPYQAAPLRPGQSPGYDVNGRALEPSIKIGSPPSSYASQPGAPQYSTSPTGDVSQYSPKSDSWMPTGVENQASINFQQNLGPSRLQEWERSNQLQDRRDAQMGLTALLSQTQGGAAPAGPSYTPYSPSSGGYDKAAEDAAYAAAKERTGQALQGALRGLKGTMAARGISGSGIEGGETRQLFESGLSDLAGTDRQLAEKRADRSFQAGQSDIDRMIQSQQFGANLSEQDAARQQQMAMERLKTVLSTYGSVY